MVWKLLVGASALSLSAAASAQTTTTGTNQVTVERSGTNNEADVDNGAAGNERNNALVRQNGHNNRAWVDQIGTANNSLVVQIDRTHEATHFQSGDRNTGILEQNGYYHRSTVEQRGTENYAVARQAGEFYVRGTIKQSGARNFADTFQAGKFQVSNILQDGTENDAGAYQRSGEFNGAEISQFGFRNYARADQGGNDNSSMAWQFGARNAAIVLQANGDRNRSMVFQNSSIGPFDDRAAFVTQRGFDNQSIVSQVAWANNAEVVQGSENSRSFGGISSIHQQTAVNLARVYMYEGSQAAPNESSILQRQIEGAISRHTALVTLSGVGNKSGVEQSGDYHDAVVSIIGGGFDSVTRRPEGNSSRLVQFGRGHVATIAIGDAPGRQAAGNRNELTQIGFVPFKFQQANVRQNGLFNTNLVYQWTRVQNAEGAGLANVTLGGLRNTVDLRQFGFETANVTSIGTGSTVTSSQYDAGGSREPAYYDFYARSVSVVRGNNHLLVDQQADNSTISVRQEGVNNSSSVSQLSGSSDNRVVVNQGRYIPAFAPRAEESLCPVGLACGGASSSIVTAVQSGSHNLADVEQYAHSSAITIEQHGRGTANMPNLIRVRHFAGTSQATARQTAGVGPSGGGDPASGNSAAQNQRNTGNPNATQDEFYFSGGARSAEIRILQRVGQNSSATVEQRGKGQFALVHQDGGNQTASILQDVGATNATAVIRQSGSGNSYSITQTQPGQYVVVTQTGTNNEVTSVVQRGPGQ